MIAIIDYNMGNLRSVQNAFDKIGKKTEIVQDPEKLIAFDKIVLPGVGAFGDAMQHLKETGMHEAITTYAKSGKAMLGVCLGMQLLFEESEEFGAHQGLGLIEGSIKAFDREKFQTHSKYHIWDGIISAPKSPLFLIIYQKVFISILSIAFMLSAMRDIR